MKRRLGERTIALVTLASFLAGTAPRPARAQSEPSAPAVEQAPEPRNEQAAPAPAAAASSEPAPAPKAETSALLIPGLGHHPVEPIDEPDVRHPPPRAPASPPARPTHPDSLPNGVDTTGVSSQVLSLPQGAGKIQGMGESFSNQLSTGTGSFSVPISMPGARGAAAPSLALAYTTSGGQGVAGVGWDVGVPFISRQTDRGNPLYQDPLAGGAWTPAQDRFVFNGGQELVPICLVAGQSCPGAQPGEVMPSWANGWQYFRPRIEGAFLRVFWSPDHQTWRVQDKSGGSMELGAPLDGRVSTGTVESDPSNPAHIYRWNLSRQYDAYGAANPASGAVPLPVNVTRYVYTVDGAISYLTDVYDTPPATSAATADVSTYAHHARLVYAPRSDVTTSYRRGWAASEGLRLVGIDVTSKTSGGGPSRARRLVRRYHLAYDPAYHASLLASVQVEGRCGTPAAGEEGEPVVEDASGKLPTVTSCPTLPAMTFGYTHVVPHRSDGSPGVADLPGYEGFDERVTTMVASPPHSVDEQYTDLFDVNSDGLPDVLVTMPGLYGGKHGLYLNQGATQPFLPTTMGVQGVLGEDATTISLDNLNVSSGDLDGDGVIDLMHMPQVKTYSVYTPQGAAGQWVWQGRSVTTAAAQSPKINLGSDGLDVQRMDVNGDGLVDVVVSTGTEMETFFSLDKYPGGDGQFGHASWTSATTASISNDPVTSCVPWDGLPVQLSDGTVKVADMNGDGLPDVVRMQQGDIHYWPGRGNGYWGTGSASACPGGSFGESQSIAMGSSPRYADPSGSALRIDDVNGDGLDDVVEVNFTDVQVWLNVDGTSWTKPHVITNAPASPAYQGRVRIVDMNGSGTRDILWGDAGQYRFMDLSGGQRPWLLTHVENGLGKTTDLTFASSPELMVAAAAAGARWASTTPMPIHVVTQMTVNDNLRVAGTPAGQYVTEYSYRDPVYDGRQREFRGFTTARERHVGDANSPSSSAESQFLLGTCQDDEAMGGLPSACTFAGRWRDNPREALKGLPLSVQTFDDNGIYQSSAHHTYRLRKLYVGLDGREVRHAFESGSDTYLYDVFSADRSASAVTTSDVELELTPPPYAAAEYLNAPSAVPTQQAGTLALHGSAGRVHLQTKSDVDVFGNGYHAIDRGCVEGCTPIDDVITQYAQASEVSGNTGWLWRNTETMTLGSKDVQGRHTTQHVYDKAGSVLFTYQYLQGTLPLVRSRAGGGTVAPAPAWASKDGWITAQIRTYDGFGNALTSTAPNHRCGATSYDPDYAQLSSSDTIDVGAVGANGCGTTLLTSSASYDRGLGAITALTDVHKERTTIDYDGFGRIVEVFRPLPTTGQPGPLPSMVLDYELPDLTGGPFSRVHTELQDGADPTVASYRESWGYVDGLGRTRVILNQADLSAGDRAPWVAMGLSTYDAKGAKRASYLDFFYPGDAGAFPLTSYVPTSPFATAQYDAFGRVFKSSGYDKAQSLENHHHALSVDAWDAADLSGGSHAGSFATSARDGHGRATTVTERSRVNGVMQSYQTTRTYLSTGEAAVVTRTNGASSVVRWMTYDTLGRMLVNVEPDTSVGFSPNPSANVAAIQAWRYAYDDDGDLVGTSDARGCGVNYAYDAGGRILGEDYSPCTADHAVYTPVVGATGYEVSYLYDVADPDTQAPAGIAGVAVSPAWPAGRLSSITDRSGKTVKGYDARGRVTVMARRLTAPAGGFAPRWYAEISGYDAADRLLTEQTEAVDSGATAPTVTSSVVTTFSKRSLIKNVKSDHGALVTSVVHDADALPLTIVYGDVAGTTTQMSYTARRQLLSVQTYRGAPAIWSSPPASYVPPPAYGGAPSTLQLLLTDLAYKYDEVDDPIEIDDLRSPSEWPSGAKPVTRTMQYDDLYRLTQVGYQYPAGSDPWTSPFAAEDQGIDPDPQRSQPSPHVSFASRIRSQTFVYDWLGNTTTTGDDLGGFYDRSLGVVTNGAATAGPYQLAGATNIASGSGSLASQGALTVAYDAAGNMTSVALARSGTCLPATAVCSQRFAYAWDEVGRLARARRWDTPTPGLASSALPTTGPAADLRYAYDATDDRTLKAAYDASGNVRYAAYPLDGLELRGATWDATIGDYERSSATQVPYMLAHGVRLARIATAETDEPSFASGTSHVFLELPEHLGSTAIVIDRDTGELVEAETYQAYGNPESDYRPQRWGSFREDYRFTGKEEDVEVGLQYFGKRYYAAGLGRWTSADPLAIHGLGADLNVYAYVHGAPYKAIDPAGLDANNTPAPAAGVTPPSPPVPGSPEAAFQSGARIGREYGRTLGAAEDFLGTLQTKWTGTWDRVSVWDRMSDAERATALARIQSELDALPTLSEMPGSVNGEAEARGFESGVASGLSEARAQALAVKIGTEALIAATPAAGEAVLTAAGKLATAASRIADSIPVIGIGAGGIGIGVVPRTWSAARKQFWRNLAASEAENPSGWFSENNLRRMAAGDAPRIQVMMRNRTTGEIVTRDIPLELHHRAIPQRAGSNVANEAWNLEIMNRWAHEAVDPYRHAGWDLIKLLKGPNSL